MSPFAAWTDGARRVRRAPAILIGVWALTLLVSVPLAVAMRSLLMTHLGQSLEADTAASGVNYDWMQEFSEQASGLGTTFKPTIIGFGAVLDNLSAFADATPRPVVIAGAAAVYALLWLFVAGGIIDRFARDRPTHASGFFAAAGQLFFRFLRLAVAQWAVYAALFGALHPFLFGTVYARLTHDMTVERNAFLVRVSLYLVFGAIVAAAMMVFDYAKVRAVVEDRRSMLGAINAAIGFIRRNAGATVALFGLNVGAFVIALAAYGLVAPGAGRAGLTMWLGLAVGQVYVLARLWIGDGAVPGTPRPCRVRRASRTAVARLPRRRCHLG